ncbi:MAG: hypothetical protein QM755_12150 [Luteolibacter sp.]
MVGSRFSSTELIGLSSFTNTTYNVVAQFADGAASGNAIIATWAANGQITIPKVADYTFSGKYDKKSGLATTTYGITDASRGLNKAKISMPRRADPEAGPHHGPLLCLDWCRSFQLHRERWNSCSGHDLGSSGLHRADQYRSHPDRQQKLLQNAIFRQW